MQKSSQKTRLRTDLQWVRGISIFGVLLFHADFNLFRNGFLGVDAFFCLSGFFVTSSIMKLSGSRWNQMKYFYLRRAKRILPSSFFVLAFTLIFGYFLLLPNSYKTLASEVIWSSLFAPNIYFWHNLDYFGSGSHFDPLIHMWSLGVEEQFYLIFGLGFIFFRKINQKVLFFLLCASVLGSLFLSVILSQKQTGANFYLLPTRAWELLLGSVASLIVVSPRYKSELISRGKIALSIFLIGLIIFSMTKFFDFSPLVDQITIVAAVFCLIVNGQNLMALERHLPFKVFAYLGKISFALYLIHQPLFAYFRIRIASVPTIIQYLILTFLSVLLAILMTNLLESRVRLSSSNLKICIAFMMSLVLLVVAAYVVSIRDGFSSRLNRQELQVMDIEKTDLSSLYLKGSCFLDSAVAGQKFSKGCFEFLANAESGSSYLIWGDSHAAALAVGLKTSIPGLAITNSTSCPPFFNLKSDDYCWEHNQQVRVIVRDLKPSNLLLAANWSTYTSEDDYQSLKRTILEVKTISPKTNVIILGSLPQWYPTLSSEILSKGIVLNREQQIPTADISHLKDIDTRLKKIAIQNGSKFVSVLDTVCINNGCYGVVRKKGGFTLSTSDYAHLTREGSVFYAERLTPFLTERK